MGIDGTILTDITRKESYVHTNLLDEGVDKFKETKTAET